METEDVMSDWILSLATLMKLKFTLKELHNKEQACQYQLPPRPILLFASLLPLYCLFQLHNATLSHLPYSRVMAPLLQEEENKMWEENTKLSKTIETSGLFITDGKDRKMREGYLYLLEVHSLISSPYPLGR